MYRRPAILVGLFLILIHTCSANPNDTVVPTPYKLDSFLKVIE